VTTMPNTYIPPKIDYRANIFSHAGLWLAICTGVLIKLLLWVTGSITFDADEAIVGLMARHIVNGQGVPLFFYGQAYMGSFDALLISVAFRVVGPSVAAIRATQTILYLMVIVTTYTLTYRVIVSQDTKRAVTARLATNHSLFGLFARPDRENIVPDQFTIRDDDGAARVGAGAAAMIIAVPTILFSLYTTATLGNYVEILILNNLLWLLGLDLLTGQKRLEGWWFLFGLLAGIGWWSMALIVVSLAPLVLIGLWRFVVWPMQSKRRTVGLDVVGWDRLGLVVVGFIIGALPWVFGTLMLGASETIGDLLGAFVSGRAAGGQSELFTRFITLIVFNIGSLVGLKPPWSIEWVFVPLGVIVSGFYLVVLWRAVRRMFRPEETDYTRFAMTAFIGGCVMLCIAFLASPFGRDATGRYLLPLYPVLAVLAGSFIGRARQGLEMGFGWWIRIVPYVLLAAVLAYNLIGIVRSIRQNPPGLTTQFDPISQLPHEYDDDLIDFLNEIGVKRGYSNYWAAYRFAFLTDEEIILLPRIPYKQDLSYTSDDNRYAPYNELVDKAGDVVYVTSNHPVLDDKLAARLRELGIEFKVEQIGPYTIFYDLTRHVTPEELGAFGETGDQSLLGGGNE